MAVAELVTQVNGLGEDERNDVILGVVEKMTVLGLSKLVKKIEEKFDVKATGGGVMMAMPAAGGAAAPVDEDKVQTEFDLILKGAGAQKIQVIKVVRELTNLSLKDAKDKVDKAPVTIKEKMSKEDVEKAKQALEEAGATVEIK